MKLVPLPGRFGTRVMDVDIARGSESLTRELAAQLFKHRILVIPDQNLSHDAYVAFARSWGKPIIVFKKDHRVEGHPEIVRQSNSPDTPDYMRNYACHWHSDSTYELDTATITMLYGIESPEKEGETLFADQVAAYAALDSDVMSEHERAI